MRVCLTYPLYTPIYPPHLCPLSPPTRVRGPGITPLHVATCFASWPIAAALLEMGATPAVAKNGFDPLMSMSGMGRADNITKWCAKFPRWNLYRRDKAAGANAMACALLLGGTNNLNTAKALVDAGMDVTKKTAQTGTIALHNAAANSDADDSAIRYLLGLPGARALVNARMRGKSFKWKVQFMVARLLVRLGSKKAILKNVCDWPMMTPLMTAARNGNTVVIKVLVEEGGADITLRNARGLTALDLLVGGENALEETRRLLAGGGHAANVSSVQQRGGGRRGRAMSEETYKMNETPPQTVRTLTPTTLTTTETATETAT